LEEEDQTDAGSDLMVKIASQRSKLKSSQRTTPSVLQEASGPFLPLSLPSKTSKHQPQHHRHLYSTRNREEDEFPRHKPNLRSPSPECINLEPEPKVYAPEESRPKIFSSTPIGTGNRFFPASIPSPSSASSSAASPSQTPWKSRKSVTIDEEDDLMIIGEKIVSPKYNPYHTNSLAMETSNSKFAKKAWLEET